MNFPLKMQLKLVKEAETKTRRIEAKNSRMEAFRTKTAVKSSKRLSYWLDFIKGELTAKSSKWLTNTS